MPAKAGIQANAAEFGAARLDSRLRGSDESGQRTGSLVLGPDGGHVAIRLRYLLG
jgi:hypothetical protein